MDRPTMGAPADAAPPPLPWLFFAVAIVAAVAVAALIAYLGLTGHLGAGIPGSKSPGGGTIFFPFVGLVLTASAQSVGRNSP
ncbi:MAG: hypothetical protein WCB19_08670, partial [Thermoplasmata archaeon]